MSDVDAAKPISLHLDSVAQGHCGLSVGAGGNAAEAATVCFFENGHMARTELTITGSESALVEVNWTDPTPAICRSHNDHQDATKDGAVAIAALCAPILFGKKVGQQSKKGTGFDYYLESNDGFLFQNAVALEISGILCNRDDIEPRVRQKIRQVQKGGAMLDTRVLVVEFSTPCARTAKP